jgi:hypothetical protein
MEGSLVAYKVFTNGSVLQASEINDNLMRQSVMVFSNAAARTAAITLPLEGMLTWLEDVNRYESYNGSAWVSTANLTGSGMVRIQSQTVTSAGSIIFNNVFSSAYRTYKVIATGTLASRGYLQIRLRSSGVDASGSNYKNSFWYRDSGGFASVYETTTSFKMAYIEADTGIGIAEIGSPFLAQQTAFLATSGGSSAADFATFYFGGAMTLGNSYDGISFIGTSNFTGTISIYGYGA